MFPSEAEPLDLGSQAPAWEPVNFIILQSAEADIVCIVAVSTADSSCSYCWCKIIKIPIA